jgi:hypothetical protein
MYVAKIRLSNGFWGRGVSHTPIGICNNGLMRYAPTPKWTGSLIQKIKKS